MVVALATLPSLSTALSIGRATSECVTKGDGGPLQVTLDCADPIYNAPIFDGEFDETSPVPHRRVVGHWDGTDIDFNMYLPPKSKFRGRFFHNVYPVQNSTEKDEVIALGVDSGAYAVRARGVVGYRSDAALAKLSRKVAQDYCNQPSRKIYGYIYGGSSGSFQVIGAMENTFDVRDGGLALIQGVPINPNNWCIRALGGLAMGNKTEALKDAVRPGSRTNPFSILNKAERAAFDEATALGISIQAWEDFEGIGQNLKNLYETIRTLVVPDVQSRDPIYVDDF